jgi:DNA-binding Lrp family transcriptional regulator
MVGKPKHDRDVVLDCIVEYGRMNGGNSPPIRLIATECGIKSTSAVSYILEELERDGKLEMKRTTYEYKGRDRVAVNIIVPIDPKEQVLHDTAPELLKLCRMQRKLLNDMVRFIGHMALRDYALLNDTFVKGNRVFAAFMDEEVVDE